LAINQPFPSCLGIKNLINIVIEYLSVVGALRPDENFNKYKTTTVVNKIFDGGVVFFALRA